MNYQDTKQKVLSWCEELKKQGIINETDLDNCRKSYNSLEQGIDLGAYSEARTSKEYSFGMLDGQGESDAISDLTRRKYFKCIIGNINMDNFLSIRPGIPGALYLSSTSIDDTIKNNDYEYLIFIIQLASNGNYTLMNEKTGNYISVNKDKTLSAESNIITDAAYFKLAQSSAKTFSFESVIYAGKYIIESNPLLVANNGNKYWVLDIIEDNIDISDTNNVATNEAKLIINNLLASITATRLEYYNILAQIEFLELLRNKMYNMVKAEGDIMSYYFDKKDTRQLDISEDLLKYIQFSINNELRAHEGSQIDDMIKELTFKAKTLESQEFNTANKKGKDLLDLLKRQINEKKTQLANLNIIIEKISAQQRDLNTKEHKIESKLAKYDTKKDIVDVNYNFTQAREAGYNTEYKIVIGASIIMIILVVGFGYKLWNRFKNVILDQK